MTENDFTKGLRFGALVRVSTEKQETQGESLRTQRTSIGQDVEALGGKVTAWYGGQEHATEGWEHKEVDRLIADAKAGKIDAVMVAFADRWSRGNPKADAALDDFAERGVRFFVGRTEMVLHNPEHRLLLGVSSVVGRFQAALTNKKSISTRIERARQGKPACGRLPYGRTWDGERWGVDPEKRALVEDAARRYLSGETTHAVAVSYGTTQPVLHDILTKRCGPEWVQEFHARKLNIHERVITEVPPLLPEETIRAVLARAEANKTYLHGRPKRSYLLGGLVYCARCGYAMCGHTNPKKGVRYYCHFYRGKGVGDCPLRPRPIVRADHLEDAVMRELFSCLGNPAAVQKAVEAAVPDRAKTDEQRRQLRGLEEQLEKVEAARERIVGAIADGTLSNALARKQLARLDEREAALKGERDALQAALGDAPTDEEIRAAAGRVAAAFGAGDADEYGDVVQAARKNVIINRRYDLMTPEEARQLALMVFGGTLPDGKRMGVYVEVASGRAWQRKTWRYQALGRLTDQWGSAPRQLTEPDPEYGEFMGGPDQPHLLREVLSRKGWCPP
jgi:DNA invertase Pin-like site-specific DNA recombinase